MAVVSVFTSIPIDYTCKVIEEICPGCTHSSDLDVDTLVEFVKFLYL